MTLKDELFNRETVSMLAGLIRQVYPKFFYDDFIDDSVNTFPSLELKERMTSVRKQLRKYLPEDYNEAINILSEAMNVRKNEGFIYGSVIEYLEAYGCNDEYYELSIIKLGEWTNSMSSEFAIRKFIDKYPKETFAKIIKWSKDEDLHKRRLASEGTRPSLPWGSKITMNYKKASQPLENLYYDKERYVTRSVANHLNDISKIDPDYVINLLKKWKNEGKQSKAEFDYITRHSLRTLIKRGHRDTLVLLGYKTNPDITVSNLSFGKAEISIGDILEFEFDLYSNDNCKVVIDYKVIFPSVTSVVPKKIYKLKELKIHDGETYKIKGKQRFKDMTTRKMRKGMHVIQFQINGKLVLEKSFVIK